MKIISLNTWAGRVGAPIFDFFRAHADADVFLLQEVMLGATPRTALHGPVRHDLFLEIAEALPDHAGIFAPTAYDEWGLAAFVRRELSLDGHGDFFVHGAKEDYVDGDGATLGRNMQHLHVRASDGSPLTVLNFHGIWTGTGKRDTDARLEQSRRIAAYVRSLDGHAALLGDFNLLPDTESIALLTREGGLRNLVVEHGVTSTRTSLYTKPEKHADYAFVSPGVRVRRFAVLPDEVSDHAPLLLEIE